MAGQARLEGRHGAMNPAAAFEAATLLIRIAFRCRAIARARLVPWNTDIVPGSSRASQSWKVPSPLNSRHPSLQDLEARKVYLGKGLKQPAPLTFIVSQSRNWRPIAVSRYSLPSSTKHSQRFSIDENRELSTSKRDFWRPRDSGQSAAPLSCNNGRPAAPGATTLWRRIERYELAVIHGKGATPTTMKIRSPGIRAHSTSRAVGVLRYSWPRACQ